MELDFDRAEREEQAALPAREFPDDDWQQGNAFHKFRLYTGKQLRTPEHEAHLKEERKKKRLKRQQDKTREAAADVVRTATPAERAAALSARMAALEKRVHEGKEPVEPLYGEVKEIMEGIRDLGALLTHHRLHVEASMDTPNYLHREQHGTVGDELFGAFEVYREILGKLETGAAKNGQEAVDLQAKETHEFLRELNAKFNGKARK